MELTIVEVERAETRPRVRFSSEVGSGTAVFFGPAPTAGDKRFVELELRPEIAEVRETDEPVGLRLEGATTIVVGRVESMADDGLVTFSVGSLRLDVQLARAVTLGRCYRFVADELEAWDCRY